MNCQPSKDSAHLPSAPHTGGRDTRNYCTWRHAPRRCSGVGFLLFWTIAPWVWNFLHRENSGIVLLSVCQTCRITTHDERILTQFSMIVLVYDLAEGRSCLEDCKDPLRFDMLATPTQWYGYVYITFQITAYNSEFTVKINGAWQLAPQTSSLPSPKKCCLRTSALSMQRRASAYFPCKLTKICYRSQRWQ